MDDKHEYTWDHWTGRRTQNIDTGETFIETTTAQWADRLAAWKSSELEGGLGCPCPMPKGHIMFDKRRTSTVYKAVDQSKETPCTIGYTIDQKRH